MERRNNVLQVSEATKRRYFRNLTDQLRDLRSAMERSDFNNIQEICHRVQGSASLFGVSDLGDACRSMELASKEQNLEEMVQCFQVIEVIVARNSGLAEAQGA